MKKLLCKENLKKILILFLLLQPLLDVYILFEENTINLFGISPSTVIRIIFIFIMGLLSLFVIKSKRQCLSYILYIVSVIVYFAIHIYNAMQFSSLMPENFNFSLVTELFYLIRMLIPLFLIIITTNIDFDKEKKFKLLNTVILMFSLTIVITNILKISIGAYVTKVIDYNVFDWFINSIHNTHSFYDTATRGYFTFANTISCLLFGFTSLLFYQLFKKINYKTILMLLIQLLAMFMLGTKVAAFGFLLSSIVMSFVYIFFTIIKKEIEFNYKIILVMTLFFGLWCLIYPYSPCKNRITGVVNEQNSSIEDEKSESINVELVDFSKELEDLNNVEQHEYLLDYVENNYQYFGVKEDYILKYYPYKYDAYFWYKMFSESYVNKTDNRILMEKILDRLKYLNDRKTMDELFGITYSRMSNIATLEKDFLSQYYTLGMIGFILLIIPYILIIVVSGIKILFDKNKFTLENVCLLLCLFSGFAGAYYCGNSLDNLTFSIIFAFVSGLLLKNIFKKEENILNDNEITIFALHLGYGGVEKYISSLCKMLEKDYKINLIVTYKLLKEPAFLFSPKINITYLIDDKPNKEEFKLALRNMNIINIFKEGLKSIKILYLRKIRNINAIRRIRSKYVITTRTFHNDLVSKYVNSNIIKIATEHNYHNNDTKYIDKLVSSIKKFDFLVVVSDSLREFYENKIGNTKCVYIPNVIDSLPSKYSNLNKNNLINIGRLENEKGHNDLLEVVSLVKKEIKDLKLFLIGDGSKRKELEEQIKKLSLEDCVEITGYLSQEDIEKYLIESKLFVMTSHSESFGLVLIEAMSYKVPCMAFDSADGAKELLKNDNGILIKKRDKRVMAEEIIKLLKNKNELQKLSNNGYSYCQKYLLNNVAKEWLKLLSKKEK